MKKMYALLLIIVSVLTLPQVAQASHAMGGDISYTWISGNDYVLRYTFYRDCMGIQAPAAVSMDISSTCYTVASVSLLPTATSPQVLQNICPGLTTNCNGGTLNGIEKWVYEDTVTLPGACADWKFSRAECCRNAAITNLTQPAGESMYLEATLDNLNFPFNSSPDFASDPVPYFYTNNLNTFNVGVSDRDNDQVIVSLTDALTGATATCLYAAGFSGANPVTTVSGLQIDTMTGNITFTPSMPEVDVIAVLIQEFRNGLLVGSCRRDFQATIINNANHLPALSGVNNTSSYSLSACAGDTVTFTIHSSDIDLADSTFIQVNGGDLAAIATITPFGSQNDSLEVRIIADGTLISPMPHRLVLGVRDNVCPYPGNQSYSYSLYVSGCSADVWPGDANNDLHCDLYDVLPIGIGMGANGPVRTNASLTWTAQTANDWTQSFVSGVNYKFADCNGDGTIDATDTVAIAQNYGFTHPVRISNPSNTQNTTGSLYLIASTNTAGPNDQLTVDLNLDQANNVYGIAFRLLFNPAVVDPSASTFHFLPSQLGTPGVDLMTFVRTDWTAGIVEAVAVRMDGQEQSIDSTIAVFDVVIVDNVSARTVLGFDLTGVRGVNATGINQYYSIVNDSVSINSGTTGIHTLSNPSATVFPNPATGAIRWNGIENVNGVVLRDFRGRKVFETDAGWSGNSLDVSGIPAGTYLIELSNNASVSRTRISVIH